MCLILIRSAADIKLYVLVKNGVIRAGDIIAYKRSFVSSDVTVEKDSLVSKMIMLSATPSRVAHHPPFV